MDLNATGLPLAAFDLPPERRDIVAMEKVLHEHAMAAGYHAPKSVVAVLLMATFLCKEAELANVCLDWANDHLMSGLADHFCPPETPDPDPTAP